MAIAGIRLLASYFTMKIIAACARAYCASVLKHYIFD